MSNFSDPQSRNEAIIQNILGASNVLEDPQSRNETILQAILNNSSYTAEAKSRIEEILIAILNGQSYNKATYSRNEAILKAIANGGEYTAAARSRMETLLLQWLEESGGVEKTVTGNPITVTDAKAKPAIALSVAINPKQSGSGDPSPTNIRPITGLSAVNVNVAGKNLFNKASYQSFYGYFSSDKIVTAPSNHVMIYMPCKPNTTYTASRKRTVTNERFGLAYTTQFPADTVSVSGIVQAAYSGTVGDDMSLTVTTGADAKYLVLWAWWSQSVNPQDTLQIEVGATATAYEAYAGQTYTIQLGQTVYGGTLDVVSGLLTINRAVVDAGTIDWNYTPASDQDHFSKFTKNIAGIKWAESARVVSQTMCDRYKSGIFGSAYAASVDKIIANSHLNNGLTIVDGDYTDAASFKTAVSGCQICYELATPITVQLTGQQVTLLAGTNNIWANSNGNLTLTYKARE